ncbi:glucosamine-6-phosphate deaminase [Bythopirellula goksoeyrii]|uniref:Glucosamine-6-phosphate deaminase 1 n=1 Tax=Bythopirellula goksoeyrii TaxID=1400387 RepID=A0A5B9QQ54_9BACT|nr:glucosamine-6-phosphate deaminase [Bythopirellula goksoeyrii]QEG36261.1 Glucosamine-6-phosphate deaminase 1 [Bythopirellula goksoeyrii]
MEIQIFQDLATVAEHAASAGAREIRAAIEARGRATVVMASAASQIQMVEALLKEPDIKWQTVRLFHLDEYVGLPIEHPASFRRFLWERFIRHLALPPREVNFLNAESNAEEECLRVGNLIRQEPVDVAFIGIGENCHIAFNDPPANFETESPFIVVRLDEQCRKQQVGEGWFRSLDGVPHQAISMSVRQIMKSKHVICTVPDERKAQAVRNSVEGPVSNQVPASILQEHPHTSLFLDSHSAALLSKHE